MIQSQRLHVAENCTHAIGLNISQSFKTLDVLEFGFVFVKSILFRVFEYFSRLAAVADKPRLISELFLLPLLGFCNNHKRSSGAAAAVVATTK